MRRIISIDPGLSKVAFAVWDPETGELDYAGLARTVFPAGMERAEKWREMAWQVDNELGLSEVGLEDSLVLEIPQIYPGPRAEDPNDLIDLAGVLGAICGKMQDGQVEWSPLPREWKGQLPKEITQQRVDLRLSQGEKNKIIWPIKSLCHNVYDAIHLGIVYLEREGLREISLPQRYPNKG